MGGQTWPLNPKFEYPPAEVMYGGQVEIRNSKQIRMTEREDSDKKH